MNLSKEDKNSRTCSKCLSELEMMQEYNSLMSMFDVPEQNYKDLCSKFCTSLKYCGMLARTCNEHKYSIGKSLSNTITPNLYGSPRNKAYELLSHIPNFFFILNSEIGESLREKNNSIYFKNLIDSKEFIDAIYEYVWTIIYSHAITTYDLTSFNGKLISTINENIRENYIKQMCNTDIPQYERLIVEGRSISDKDYVCGRALGKI